MRKLLLTSSALVAAASISSYATADVSVTGAFEWTYSSTSSNITATDGDAMGVNNELTIKFTNKTDSGLTLTGVYDIDADASAADESWMSIGGGFGTLTLGKESSVNDAFGIGEQDLIDEMYVTEIEESFNGDTYFPEINPSIWSRERLFTHPKDALNPHRFSVYRYYFIGNDSGIYFSKT